jgi:glycogen synthase
VIRLPPPLALLALIRWCDVYFHNHVSLRTAWPLLLVRKPWVVKHAGWIPRHGPGGWRGRLKHSLLRRAICISNSSPVAEGFRSPSRVIGNPYDDSVFREIPGIPRDKELTFCARLVPTKGADVLLGALAILSSRNLHPGLTIIGSGPEENKLRAMARDLEIADRVHFAGIKRGIELAELLNRHRIMVVPSTWPEPFGNVALEGIACGCVVVGSEGGGLKDAIGSCGVTFPNGDTEALAERLAALLCAPESLACYRTNAPIHLMHHTKGAAADAYLQVFEAAVHRELSRPVRARPVSRVR